MARLRAAYALAARRLEDVVCPDDVVREDLFPRCFIGNPRQVDDCVHGFGGFEYGVKVGDVADDRVFKVGHRHPIKTTQRILVLHAFDQCGTNRPARTCDKNLHLLILYRVPQDRKPVCGNLRL